MSPDDLPELEVFHGELTPARAIVYARLPKTGDESLRLTGSIRGPRCLHAQTLPASWPLVDSGPGPTLLARAVVTEPCFWSAELPAIYDVTVRLERGAEVIAVARREIGLRGLGTRGRQLIWQGRNVVLRGVCNSSTTAQLPREFHDAMAAYITCEPVDEHLAEASQWGALTVADVNGPVSELTFRLRELSRHPAVGIAILDADVPVDTGKSLSGFNFLLATRFHRSVQIPPWAKLLIVEADDIAVANEIDLPIVAVRKLDRPQDLASVRAACDALQRELATFGQFAGYIV